MKIAITGTRGIPNTYGGFEQFATVLAVRLAQSGHQVTVYNSRSHIYKDKTYQGVDIIRKRNPEILFGAAASYIYDFLCIKDAVSQGADLILECGYASAAPAYSLLNFGKTLLITHMDGMEWQREKWSCFTKNIIKRSERIAINSSDAIICDSLAISDYYRQKYGTDSHYIPYGSEITDDPVPDLPEQYGLFRGEYYLAVARFEPENNIETIIRGFLKEDTAEKLVLVGATDTGNGRKIRKLFGSQSRILFLEGIFNEPLLNTLRHFSKAYFHGHSAGGTNPSLLEAMGAGALIIAHDNVFNREVTGDNAYYFKDPGDVSSILNELGSRESLAKINSDRDSFISQNLNKVKEKYNWDLITKSYLELFESLIKQ